MGLKGGISIDADYGPLGYVLWCCGSMYKLRSIYFFSNWLWPYCEGSSKRKDAGSTAQFFSCVHKKIKIHLGSYKYFVSSLFSSYRVYLSAIAIPPIKKKIEKFLIQMFPNVPNDVIGVWHLLLIFFLSNFLTRLSNAMQMWNIMCPKIHTKYRYNAIGIFIVVSSCATSNHFPKQICWKVFIIEE